MSSDPTRDPIHLGSVPHRTSDEVKPCHRPDEGSGINASSTWSFTTLGRASAFWKGRSTRRSTGASSTTTAGRPPIADTGTASTRRTERGQKRHPRQHLLSGFGYGIHAYGGSQRISTTSTLGQHDFQHRDLSDVGPPETSSSAGRASPKIPSSPNFMYRSPAPVAHFHLGYNAGCSDATVIGNYVSSDHTSSTACRPPRCGNTFYGTIVGVIQSAVSQTILLSSRPTGTMVFVRPNEYEHGRANITIFNWGLLDSVAVDLSRHLSPGTTTRSETPRTSSVRPSFPGPTTEASSRFR